MKLTNVVGILVLIIFNILCDGDLTSRLINTALQNKIHKSLEPNLDVGLVHRWKREMNESNAERRIALQDQPKNLTASNETDAERERQLLHEKFKRLWPVEKWRETGFFTDDYLYLINTHWLQFPPPSPSLQKTLGGLYLFFSTVGCWGNVLVLFMYFRSPIPCICNKLRVETHLHLNCQRICCFQQYP